MNLFLDNLEQHARVIAQLHELDRVVQEAIDAISAVVRGGGKVLVGGNGGSVADAQHIAVGVVGRRTDERRPCPRSS